MLKIYGKLLKNSIIIPVILLILFVVTVKYPFLKENSQTLGFRADILVINKDIGSDLTKSLIKYLGGYGELIISDSSGAYIDYLSTVQYDYIVDIPKDYQQDFLEGSQPVIGITEIGKEESLPLTQMIDGFLNKAEVYLKEKQEITNKDLASYLDKEMQSQVSVIMEQEDINYSNNLYSAVYIKEAAYFMIFLCFFAIGRISGYFGEGGIHKRHEIAPISLRKNDFRLFLANCSFLLVCNGVFAVLMPILKPNFYFQVNMPVYLLNLLVYSLCILGICYILTALSYRHGINIILIILFAALMGFLNGDLGGRQTGYLTLAAEFTPLYWLKKINEAAGNLKGFSWQYIKQVLYLFATNILIAGTYFCLSLVINKYRIEKNNK